MRRTRCWYTKRRSQMEMFMASDRPLGRSEKTETLEAIPPAELDRLQQVELSLKGLKQVSSGRSEIGNLPGIPQRKASKDASNVLLQKFTRRTEVHFGNRLCARSGRGLTGCAVGPKYHRPTMNLHPFHNAPSTETRTASLPAPPLYQWWTGFRDPELTRIVKRTLGVEESRRSVVGPHRIEA